MPNDLEVGDLFGGKALVCHGAGCVGLIVDGEKGQRAGLTLSPVQADRLGELLKVQAIGAQQAQEARFEASMEELKRWRNAKATELHMNWRNTVIKGLIDIESTNTIEPSGLSVRIARVYTQDMQVEDVKVPVEQLPEFLGQFGIVASFR